MFFPLLNELGEQPRKAAISCEKSNLTEGGMDQEIWDNLGPKGDNTTSRGFSITAEEFEAAKWMLRVLQRVLVV